MFLNRPNGIFEILFDFYSSTFLLQFSHFALLVLSNKFLMKKMYSLKLNCAKKKVCPVALKIINLSLVHSRNYATLNVSSSENGIS